MNADALRQAGAILPGKPGRDRGVDTITARSYEHPALEGRTVVRLVPGSLGEAEDLSLEFLGFAPAAKPVAVGHGRRQALGFPAWALINDPANGRHALALVKEMERLARLAKSKPGNAKDGYDELARRLDAAVPHFLPTFWEQAGRAYVAAENGKAAGTCFAAARLAEQVHGLPIDEDRLSDVHLEFAFAGALTAKALSEYARAIVDRQPAPEAYRLVRAIALRRVAGGLPPSVSMADDLRRLAKAAGLKPDAEAESMVADLLAYPAIAKAHEGFWKAYRAPLLRLAKRDPAVRGKLLALLPDPPGWDVDITEDWLALLEDAGAADALRSPDTAPAAARPAGGVATWAQRFLDHRYRGYRGYRGLARSPRWLALLEQIVGHVRDELRASGRPVRMASSPRQEIDLDVLDICLADGVPVAELPEVEHYRQQFNIRHWAAGPDAGRRDLAAVAADPRFLRPLVRGLRTALGAYGGDDSHVRRQAASRSENWSLEPVGLRTAAQTWLTGLGEWLGATPTAPALAQALDLIAPLWTPGAFALAPEVFEQLASADIHEALARSLRGGFAVELGWPDYEKAYVELKSPSATESWPALLLSDALRVILVGPEGERLEHAYRLPATGGPRPTETPRPVHVDGQFAVTWSAGGYWSGRPTEVFEAGYQHWNTYSAVGVSLALPQGGRTTGARPLRVGDTAAPDRRGILCDGESYWRIEAPDVPRPWAVPALHWREYDPATGADGRVSAPTFLDVPLADGDALRFDLCYLHPAPDAYASSPLGFADGLVGWRVVRHADGSFTGTGIDGRSVRWSPTDDGWNVDFVGALRLPGDETPRPVTVQRTGYWPPQEQVTVWDADGRHPATRWQSGATLPPSMFWHALRPRDERGSAALRAADAALASRLLAACASASAADLMVTARESVRARFTEISDPFLVTALASAVSQAEQVRRLQEELRQLVASQTAAPKAPKRPAARDVTDAALGRALAGLVGAVRYFQRYEDFSETMINQVVAIGARLAGEDTGAPLPPADTSWSELLPWRGAVAVRAASPVTSAVDRMALGSLLAALSAIDLTGTRARVLAVTLSGDMTFRDNPSAVLRTPTSTFIVLGGPALYHGDAGRYVRSAIEVSPTGEFSVPPNITSVIETPAAGWGDPARLTAVADLLRERGAVPWRPESVQRLVEATGMTRAEAALLLAGLPGLSTHEANFLDQGQRALLGLKATEARTARDSLSLMPSAQRLSLLEAAMPADPEDLWREGPDVDALGARWRELFGVTTTVPEELLTEAGRMVPGRDSADVVRSLAAPRAGDWLNTDGATNVDGYSAHTTSTYGDAFAANHLAAVAVALPWLAYRLPAGDPIRAALPAAYELVRQRLRNSELLVGYAYRVGEVPDGLPALVVAGPRPEYQLVYVRPAQLSGPDDPALAFIDQETRASLRLLLSEAFAATIAAIPGDPTPPGRFPHDPRVSVPDLVEAAAAAYTLDSDAATYYLQLLALPDPTDRRVAEWNGWTPVTLRAAKTVLAATDLVVEAKRERAGRSLFLPGGWLPLKAPDLPVETWKTALGIGLDGTMPGRRVLVPSTVEMLFRAAWSRILAGDLPRYHTLSETR